jgi:hypothetical protein
MIDEFMDRQMEGLDGFGLAFFFPLMAVSIAYLMARPKTKEKVV